MYVCVYILYIWYPSRTYLFALSVVFTMNSAHVEVICLMVFWGECGGAIYIYIHIAYTHVVQCFFNPPTLRTDKCTLVAFLGLLVELVMAPRTVYLELAIYFAFTRRQSCNR